MAMIAYYLGALAIFSVGGLMLSKTWVNSAWSNTDEDRSKRRIAIIISILAVLAALAGMARQIVKHRRMMALAAVEMAQAPATAEAPLPAKVETPQAKSLRALRSALSQFSQKQYDAAIKSVNLALEIDPKNVGALVLRGNIYVAQKLWDKAKDDYQTALRLTTRTTPIDFNLAEIDFMQKRYDLARPGFAGLQKDPDMGDLATYKVYLCDLFGGHPDVAAQELATLNNVAANPSYYFANAATCLYQHKVDDARPWLDSAARIYPAWKFKTYFASLTELGFPATMSEQPPDATIFHN